MTASFTLFTMSYWSVVIIVSNRMAIVNARTQKKNCRTAYIHFTDKYKYKYIENVRARARANALAREYNDKVPLI